MRNWLIIIATVVATQSSPAFAIEKNSIERAQAAFDAQLALDCVQHEQIDWIAGDAVYQYTLSDIDVSLRVEGRAAVVAHLCALLSLAPDTIEKNIRFYPTLNPEITYVQYDVVTIDGTGEHSSEVAAVIEMRAGRIVGFTQLSPSPESIAVLEAATGRID